MDVPVGAEVVNRAGKTLIPGLVVLHEHLYYTMPAGEYKLYMYATRADLAAVVREAPECRGLTLGRH